MEKTTLLRKVLDVDFILVNSAYHCDHSYGLIKTSHFQQALAESSSPAKFVVVHHNLIPVERTDKSTIANTYPVLQMALSAGVKAIFHGHSHVETVLCLGKKSCYLVGVGSLLFPPRSNSNNQFNLIEIKEGEMKRAFAYRFTKDISSSDTGGSFATKKIPIL